MMNAEIKKVSTSETGMEYSTPSKPKNKMCIRDSLKDHAKIPDGKNRAIIHEMSSSKIRRSADPKHRRRGLARVFQIVL